MEVRLTACGGQPRSPERVDFVHAGHARREKLRWTSRARDVEWTGRAFNSTGQQCGVATLEINA